MSINRNPSPEVSQALTEAVLAASRQQGILLGWALGVGGIYEQLGRNIAAGVQAGIKYEYRELSVHPSVAIIDAEYTVGEAKPHE